MMVTMGCIVEGHGEVLALPVLLRRITQSIDPAVTLKTAIRRIPKSQLVRSGEIERAVEALSRQLGRGSPILVLIDADADCPKILTQELLDRCRSGHRDVDVSIIVAKAEYEAWFIAAARSLAGKGNLLASVSAPPVPEAIRGAKEWLTDHMSPGHRYVETRHQPAFSALLALEEARAARSFQKLEKEVRRQVTHRLDRT